MWRYVSFDTYFTFGKIVIDLPMTEHWPRDIKFVPVGSFGARREDYEHRLDDRPGHILIMCAVAIGYPRLTEFVRDLAAQFPDRVVYLQVKSTFVNTTAGKSFIAACLENCPNLVLAQEPLFSLFRKARYSFSDPSSVVVESLQFGMTAFCIDILEEQQNTIFRNYPQLCVNSGEEAAQRIRAIEAGEAAYRRADFGDLVDMSGLPFVDAVREEVNLPARWQTRSAQPISTVVPRQPDGLE